MDSIEIRFVIEPSNILFGGVHVCTFQPGNFTGCGSPTGLSSIAFRHLPPNSARNSYATEGALFISAQLSTDAVSTLRKVWVLIRLWKHPSVQAPM